MWSISTLMHCDVHYYLCKTMFSYLLKHILPHWYLVWTCLLHFSHLLPARDKKIISCRLYSFLDTCSLKKHLVFIQHTGRCRLFCMGFSTFQHLASWLGSAIWISPDESAQLPAAQQRGVFPPTSLATALALISLSADFSFSHFALLFLECESWWLIILVFCHLPNLSACLISR